MQGAISETGIIDPSIEKEIVTAMFSEHVWVERQLLRLREDPCADAWRVWRLQELADYCRRSPMPAKHIGGIAEFLDPRFSAQVQRSAADCIRQLLPTASRPATVTEATVEWLDGELAVVRFEHPTLGAIEREFTRDDLPAGAAEGDRFELSIEVDSTGRVCEYRPLPDRLIKAQSSEREQIPHPSAPKDLDDPEQMARYESEMEEYLRKVLPLEAKSSAEWRAQRKNNKRR